MMLESQIREVFEYQISYLKQLPSGTLREILNKMDFSDTHVKILTGVRRCGKSTVLFQLTKKEGNPNILSFEDPRLSLFEVNDFFKLEKIFEANGGNGIFFFDEIQNIKGWERYVRVLHDQKKKVIITGSNARILSAEFGTSLTGRQISYEIFPFSFSEYLNHFEATANLANFSDYLALGGFPEYLTSKKIDVLINLFNDLIYRDIVARHGLRNPNIVRELGVFLASNIGKVFSFNNLVKNFDLGSGNTVKTYISYFEDAFLFFAIPRFSYSFQQQIKNPKKIYGIDTGLITTLSMSFSKDKGRLLENKVFIHLKRMGKEIYYYQQKGECDFIVSKNNHVEFAAQVCYDLTPENLDRELNGLLEAMAELNLQEGYIFTMDQQEQLEKGGKKIQVIPVWKWMLEPA